MEILSLEDISLTYKKDTNFKNEYEKLYQEALILKNNPESDEYKENKRLRELNINRRLEIFRG